MPKSHSGDPKSKPNLRLVKIKPVVRLGGILPAEDMPAAQYLAACEHAWLEDMKKSWRAALQFRVVDGKYDGVALRQWIDNAADAGGIISPIGKYARHCWIALARELRNGDPVDEPGRIFSGHRFIVFAGYRKSELPGGRGKQSPDFALIRKDADDYLRVHEILRLEDI